MRTSIETVSENDPEEVIIRCRHITPEVEAMARQFESIEKPRAYPVFYKGDSQYYLTLDEILFFETDDERVFAHTATESFETRTRLYELEGMLPDSFVRISRSAIVNIRHVYSIQKGLTRVCQVAFRQSHKIIYCSRMYSHHLINKMEARVHL